MKTLNLLVSLLLIGTMSTQAQILPQDLYPEPQEIIISSQQYTPTRGYALRGISNPDPDAVKLLKKALPFAQSGKTLPLEIKKIKAKTPEMKRSGAYTLVITQKGITIEIVDDRSLFYAAQTLNQLSGYGEKGTRVLPLCSIKDYPSVAHRGIVEGFYGEPWSHADRVEQLRFYGKLKMNTYIYGPKDDPYHSSPNWREPYPAEQAQQIKELTTEAARNKVDFVWAIHPGQDIQWNRTDSLNIITKFGQMYDLGVRAFAVFFDDISGEGAKPEKQAGLLNYIQKEFIEKKPDLQPLIMCPTEYNRAWATTDYLDILGEQLDPAVQIMWTGDRVIADITKEGLEWVNKRIRRPAYVWWNFPVNDYCRDHLLMGPAYGLDTEAAYAMTGFVANPMERAEASKVGLFGVGLYTWNMSAYDPEKAFEASCKYIMPNATIAFRTFCENNSDPGPNGHLYRREESARYKAAAESFLASYKKGSFLETAANRMGSLFTQITVAPDMIYSRSKNMALIKEINPWLQQFQLLGQAGTQSLLMAHAWYSKDKSATWYRYLRLNSLLDSMKIINRTFNQNPYQKGVKTGSLVLTPFIHELYRQTSRNLLASDETPASEVNMSMASTLTNVEQLKHQPYSDDDNQIAYVPLYEVIRVEPGEYIGLGWEIQKEAASFNFNMPKSNVPGRVFEWSADGKSWTVMQDIPAGDVKETVTSIDPKARYIRMRNNSDKQMQLYVLSFSVKTKEAPEVNEELMMYDSNLSTFKVLEPGEKVHVKCNDTDKIEFYLSGDNDSMISITSPEPDGGEHILYYGYADYIKLDKSAFEGADTIEISAINKPIRIHQIVR